MSATLTMIGRAASVLALAFLAAPTARAQHATVPPPGASPSYLRHAYSTGRRDSVRIPETYWREGAIAGGAVVGFLGAIVGVGFCHFDDPCPNAVIPAVAGFVLGALAGVGVGAMIGGQFPKHERD